MHDHVLQFDYIRIALKALQRLDLVSDFSLKTLVQFALLNDFHRYFGLGEVIDAHYKKRLNTGLE
jgi:hypothetical protein